MLLLTGGGFGGLYDVDYPVFRRGQEVFLKFERALLEGESASIIFSRAQTPYPNNIQCN